MSPDQLVNHKKYKGYTHFWNSKILRNLVPSQEVNTDILNFYPESNIVYTLPTSGNHLEKILNLIEYGIENGESIFLSSFVLNYQPIIEKLIEASNKLPGKIYVLTVFSRNDIRAVVRSPHEEEAHFTSLQKFVNAGIRVRNNPDGHWKFIVVGTRSVVTSANITSPAFSINPEFGLLLFSGHSDVLKRWFVDVWNHHTDEERRDKTNYRLTKSTQHSCSLSNYGTKIEILSTYDGTKHKTKLMSLLGNSMESIHLTTYKLTNPGLINLLNKKADDGISVQIILPRSSHFRKDSYKAIKLLSEKIDVKYCLETHCKIMIIDNQQVVISTGNLDKYLNQPNFDISIITEIKEIITSTSAFFDILWKVGFKKIDEENVDPGSWMDNLSLRVLIDSPLRIHPKLYNEDLESFVNKIDASDLISVYHMSDDVTYLKFPTKTERKDILKLIRIENGFRIQPLIKDEWEILNNLDVHYYETIEFDIVWIDFLRE